MLRSQSLNASRERAYLLVTSHQRDPHQYTFLWRSNREVSSADGCIKHTNKIPDEKNQIQSNSCNVRSNNMQPDAHNRPYFRFRVCLYYCIALTTYRVDRIRRNFIFNIWKRANWTEILLQNKCYILCQTKQDKQKKNNYQTNWSLNHISIVDIFYAYPSEDHSFLDWWFEYPLNWQESFAVKKKQERFVFNPLGQYWKPICYAFHSIVLSTVKMPSIKNWYELALAWDGRHSKRNDIYPRQAILSTNNIILIISIF